MKSLSILLSVALVSLCAFAQSDAQPDTHAHKAVNTAAPKSEAQKSFETIVGRNTVSKNVSKGVLKGSDGVVAVLC